MPTASLPNAAHYQSGRPLNSCTRVVKLRCNKKRYKGTGTLFDVHLLSFCSFLRRRGEAMGRLERIKIVERSKLTYLLGCSKQAWLPLLSSLLLYDHPAEEESHQRHITNSTFTGISRSGQSWPNLTRSCWPLWAKALNVPASQDTPLLINPFHPILARLSLCLYKTSCLSNICVRYFVRFDSQGAKKVTRSE